MVTLCCVFITTSEDKLKRSTYAGLPNSLKSWSATEWKVLSRREECVGEEASKDGGESAFLCACGESSAERSMRW